MRAALLALALPLLAAKPFPEPPRDYVHNEGVVSPASEQRLSSTLAGFERETGHQFVVALFASLEGESLEDYSNRLFKHWRVGDAKRNDGVLVALFQADRRWRVEVGYGLEGALTDLEAGAMLEDYAVPRFRRGDFDGGMEAAVAALSAKLGGRAPAPAPDEGAGDYRYGPDEWKLVAFFIVIIIVVSIIQSSLPGSGRRGRHGGWSSGGGGSWGGGGGGGFSGGGGSSGGGGASGSW